MKKIAFLFIISCTACVFAGMTAPEVQCWMSVNGGTADIWNPMATANGSPETWDYDGTFMGGGYKVTLDSTIEVDPIDRSAYSRLVRILVYCLYQEPRQSLIWNPRAFLKPAQTNRHCLRQLLAAL